MSISTLHSSTLALDGTGPAVTVFHHADCLDGFTAAWAVADGFARVERAVESVPSSIARVLPSEVRCVAWEYHSTAADEEAALRHVAAGGLVYVVDVAVSMPFMSALVDKASGVTWIDHHKSADRYVEPYQNIGVHVRFDMSHSAAWLAWDECVGELPVPSPLLAVEDRDLWKWEYSDTEAVTAALAIRRMSLSDWSYAMGALKELREEGITLVKSRNKRVAAACKEARYIPFHGHAAAIVSAPGDIRSEVGSELLASSVNVDIAIVERALETGTAYSLRSRQGGVDVSVLAEQHGGGGHPTAAAFFVERDEEPLADA